MHCYAALGSRSPCTSNNTQPGDGSLLACPKDSIYTPPHASLPAVLTLQAEVEAFYINNGYMFPSFHKFYWMGLRAASSLRPSDLMALSGNTWPSFSYIDGSPSPGGGVFAHWGRYQPLNYPEPDNRFAPELCAGGNATEAFGTPRAWGWADTRCNGTFPFICRLQRECLSLALAALSEPPAVHASRRHVY
jgi:hypothetical protein